MADLPWREAAELVLFFFPCMHHPYINAMH